MQNSCNGTRVSDNYEIEGSVTAGEIFAEAWERDVTVRLNRSQFLRAPPLRGGGVLQVKCQMQHLGLVCYWA